MSDTTTPSKATSQTPLAPSEAQLTYLPCRHCDWLYLPGEIHYCPPCETVHTAESTWDEQ